MNKSNTESESKESDECNAKYKQKGRGKKRKRPASESSTDGEVVLPENTLEVEKNLHASAIKNNLDDVSVKKILKKVVTNDHVLALVKLREEEEDSINCFPWNNNDLHKHALSQLFSIVPRIKLTF